MFPLNAVASGSMKNAQMELAATPNHPINPLIDQNDDISKEFERLLISFLRNLWVGYGSKADNLSSFWTKP